MDNLELVFGQSENAAGSPVEIVFGDDDDGGLPSGVVELGITGRITGLRGTIAIHRRVEVHAAGRITGLRGTMQILHTINVARPLVNASRGTWQNAQRASHALQIRYERAGQIGFGVQSGYQLAERVSLSVQGRFEQTTRLSRSVLQAFQQAQRVGAVPVLQRFESAGNVRAVVAHGFEQARRASGAPVLEQYADALHLKRIVVQRYEKSQQLSSGLADSFGVADRWSRALQARYEYARKPSAGKTPIVKPTEPTLEPCYVSGLPVELLFIDAADASLPVQLVFVCERHVPIDPEQPGETVVVPIKEVYLTINDAVLLRFDNGKPIPTRSMSMSLDRDSWTWNFSASVPEGSKADVLPNSNGDPVLVSAQINGTPFVFRVERVGRGRAFNSANLQIQGRGRSAELDVGEEVFTNTGALSGRQILDQILMLNGAMTDWDVGVFQPTDWQVPAGVFNFSGTRMGALNTVAAAVGAYVQPHDTAKTVNVFLNYPIPPWKWQTVTPDFELPVDVTSQEDIDWVDKPAYNQVFVIGQEHGVLGQYRRSGTAGDLLAPTVIDPLITDVNAVRQRGRSIISNTGRIANVTLKLPILAETGIIRPGKFVRYLEGNETLIGITRSVSVDVAMPTIYQTLTVETHVEPV